MTGKYLALQAAPWGIHVICTYVNAVFFNVYVRRDAFCFWPRRIGTASDVYTCCLIYVAQKNKTCIFPL